MSSSEVSLLYSSIRQLLHEGKADIEIIDLLNFPQSHSLPPEFLIPRLLIAGLVYFRSSSPNLVKAKKFFKRCENCCVTSKCVKPRDGDIAVCNICLGDIEYISHMFSDAAKHYSKAIKFYASIFDFYSVTASIFDFHSVAAYFKLSRLIPSLSSLYCKLANSLAKSGESKSVQHNAVVQYRAAIQEARSDKDVISARMCLGKFYFSVRMYHDALEQFTKCLELRHHLQNPLCLGKVHGNMAYTHLKLGNKEEAICHLQRMIRLVTEYERDSTERYVAFNHAGSAYQSMNDTDKAEEYYTRALEEAADIPRTVRMHEKIGNVLLKSKEYERAIHRYSEILRLSSDPTTKNTARLNRGYSYVKCAFLPYVQETEIHGSHCDVDKCLSKVSHSTKSLFDQGSCDLKKALEHYEQHIQKRNGFALISHDFRLACSCLQDSFAVLHHFEEALVVAEKYRARLLGEQMLKQELFHSKSSIVSHVSFAHIRKIIKDLQCPVVYLSYTGSRIICWVLVSHSKEVLMKTYSVPVSSDLFGGQTFTHFLVHELTSSLMHPGNNVYQSIPCDGEFSRQVRVLFDLIGRPLVKILDDFANKTGSSFSKLIIISDECSSLVPLGCLYDQSSKSFLADKYCFLKAPSFLTLDIMLHQPNVIVKLPSESSLIRVIGSPDVAYSQEETEWVSNAFQTSPILQHETMLSLRLKLLDAKLIHFANSGFEENGSIILSSGRDSGTSDVSLSPQAIQRLNISPSLVTLTNCGEFVTTTIKANRIEEMCQAFIQAGARAVLTSLWKVPKESAIVFVQFFYQYLLNGLQSSLALQKAILSIRCFPEFSQYIHWSGYQLIGRDFTLSNEDAELTHRLRMKLGPATIFPRFLAVQKLKNELISNNQTMVQVCVPINNEN